MAMLKRAYKAIAVLAILHMLALGAGIGYLVATGNLDVERVRAIAEIFKAQPDAVDGDADTDAADSTAILASNQGAAPDPVGEEIRRRSLEREYMQAEHRLILANRQMMEVRRRQEEFERREAQQAAERELLAEKETQEGFQRDIEILSMLKPKVAVETILARPVDEAARLMLELEPRKTKKIMETANKNPRQWTQMLEIQQRMRDLSGDDESTGLQAS